jgi:carbon monoxide dehydrogenase subunit G
MVEGVFMITVERRRLIAASPETVKAVLADIEHIRQLLPWAEQVEVGPTNDGRSRVTISFRVGRLGTQRIEGEARVTADGMRFIAVRPFETDARWTVQARDASSEVTNRLSINPGATFSKLLRFVPQRMIEQRLGRELDAALDTVERLASAK